MPADAVTTRDLAQHVIDLVYQLSDARDEVRAYRRLAIIAIHHAAELTRELEMTARSRETFQKYTDTPDAERE